MSFVRTIKLTKCYLYIRMLNLTKIVMYQTKSISRCIVFLSVVKVYKFYLKYKLWKGSSGIVPLFKKTFPLDWVTSWQDGTKVNAANKSSFQFHI